MKNPFAAARPLREAQDAVTAALARLAAARVAAQLDCDHPLVIQNPSRGSGPNRRVCCTCRLVEEGTHWSYNKANWNRADYKDPVLGNEEGRQIIQLHTDTFYEWVKDANFCTVD